MAGKIVNLEGNRFGKLTVESVDHIGSKYNKFWKCICDCGEQIIVAHSSLQKGSTRSCGCLYNNPHNKNPNRLEAIQRQLFRGFLQRCERRELNVEISFEEWKSIIVKPCYYCGVESSCKRIDNFNYRRKDKNCISSKEEFKYNGVDRVDNSKGYISSNCYPCCFTCNAAKGTMTLKQFESWISKIYHHYFVDKTEYL